MKMYTIEMNEIMAEQVMIMISAATEGDDPKVCDKFAEVVPIIPSDCSNVTVSLTADEMYEVFNTYIDITGGR